MRLIDITGQRFGRALVLRKSKAARKNGGSNWDCLCDCGNQFTAIGSNLRKGDTTSCGCLAREWASRMGSDPSLIAIRGESRVKHGHKRRGSVSPEYRTWLQMKRRCYDEKCKDYRNWGARGIRVDEPWFSSFSAFLNDMGPKPSPEHSIDRLDPNGNYSKWNCRWATPKQQSSENKRNLIVLDPLGFGSVGFNEACAFFGVPYSRAHMRLTEGKSIAFQVFSSHKGHRFSRVVLADAIAKIQQNLPF